MCIRDRLNPPGKALRRPQVGGVFANYLHPVAFNEEKKRNPAVKASDAWGFVPPPLIGEGEKVQTRWLHDFLLEPFAIRPAAVLRMPKFHMTSDEAQAIVHHFAALDNVDYPYEFDRRLQGDYLSSANAAYETTKKAAQAEAAKAPPPPAPAPGATAPLPTVPAGDKSRLDDAMTLVTDNGFCVKCHLVGDFRPAGASAGLAPNLAGVATRLRPDYLKKWIANPGRILPYTGMPVNFPKTQSVAQNLFKGTSEQPVSYTHLDVYKRQVQQGRPEPPLRRREERSGVPLQLDHGSEKLPADDEDAAVLRFAEALGRRREARR